MRLSAADLRALADAVPRGAVVGDRYGDLSTIVEPQGQSYYVGSDTVIATTGGFHKAHGEGAAINPETGRAYRTQCAYLTDLLGVSEYQRIFGK